MVESALPMLNQDESLDMFLSSKYITLLDTKWKIYPKRFSCFINFLIRLKNEKQKEKIQYYERLQSGIKKLTETHEFVENLKLEAKNQETALNEKRALANQSLEMISSTMIKVNLQKSNLMELKKNTENNNEKLIIRKAAIENELSLVAPILQEASAAVSQIKNEALSEIRSLRAPPDIVRDVLEGVLRLMGVRDTSWNSMKMFLAKRGVKEDIRSLDPSQISAENLAATEKLLKAKPDSFNDKNAKRASAAAEPLAIWVKANLQYGKVVQSIQPLQKEQNELQKNLEKAEMEMASLVTGIADVNSKVTNLSDQLNIYTKEAAVLEMKLIEAR